MTRGRDMSPCGRCGRWTTPRGGRPPRYCATCGEPLAARVAEDAAVPPPSGRVAQPPRPALAPLAVVALVLGLGALMPACGIVPGVLAMVLGTVARRRIDDAAGALRGRPLATAGLALGTVGVLLQGLMCLGVR